MSRYILPLLIIGFRVEIIEKTNDGWGPEANKDSFINVIFHKKVVFTYKDDDYGHC